MLNRMRIPGAVALGLPLVASLASTLFAVTHSVAARPVQARGRP